MDNFKQHIQEQLHKMEVDEPSPMVWKKIEATLPTPQKKVIHLPLKWLVAACVVLLAGIGLLVFTKEKAQPVVVVQPSKSIEKRNIPLQKDSPTISQPVVIAQEKKPVILAATTQKTMGHLQKENRIPRATSEAKSTAQLDLQNIENSFEQIINLQKTRVNTTPLNAESPSYFTEFSLQVKQTEKDEAAIKKEIRKHGITNELLDQLINIYQQKLNVLKQLQTEMQKTNNRYKQGRSPVDTSKIYFLNI